MSLKNNFVKRHTIFFSFWVFIGIYGLVAECTAQTYKVVGYFNTFGINYTVKYQKLTHINYFGAVTNSDGSLSGIVNNSFITEAHNAGCKVLLTIGGDLSKMVADTGKRNRFVRTLTDYITSHHYDGADFDWEFPASSADSAGEHALMKQIYVAFQAKDTTLLITMAIGAGPTSAGSTRWRNYRVLNQYVNWYNVMDYDLDQESQGKSGYNAALYNDNIGYDYSVNASILSLSGGSNPLIPKNKLVLGVPFFGKQFNSATFNAAYTIEESEKKYSDIYTMLQSGGWIYHFDNIAKVPYLTNGSSVVTYDDSMSIALKCQYMKAHNMSGIMIWEMAEDIVGSTQPLLDVIWDQLNTPVNIFENPSSGLITEYRLYNNYPNPFNTTTTIRFFLPTASLVTIKVYDIYEREVATLLNGYKNPGISSLQFETSQYHLLSGVYFYQMQAGAFTETKKLLLLK